MSKSHAKVTLQIEASADLSSLNSERVACFDRFFNGVNDSTVTRLDRVSEHFCIRSQATGEVIGGFRLTAIGTGDSEIEQLFPDFPFLEHSMELGGFWVSAAVNEAASGWLAVDDTFRFARTKAQRIYFKTSQLKGRASRRYGAVSENRSATNPALGYVCHLYRL